MIDERLEELAALDALDLLSPAEKAELQAALAGNADLAAQVRELRQAAAALAHTAPAAEPPAALRDRVLQSVAGVPAKAKPKAAILSFSALLPWAIAACLVAAAAWTGHLYRSVKAQNAMLMDAGVIADLELRRTRNQLEAERIVNQRELTDARRELAGEAGRIADLNRQIADLGRPPAASGSLTEYKVADLASTRESSGQTLAVAVWCPSMQQGILAVSHLPRIPLGRAYQLWVIDPHYAAPVSGGVFAVDPATGAARVTFTTARPIKSIAKFAVSVERSGGAEAPQGPIVLLSDSPTQPD